LATRRGCDVGRLRLLQIGQVRLANPAAAILGHVKTDKVGRGRFKDFEQESAKLFARRAANPVPAPDFGERMNARVSLAAQADEPLREFGIFSQSLFERRHALHWQGFIQKGDQLCIGKRHLG
jgi:hypothetical protein